MKTKLTGALVLASLAAPLSAQAEGKIYGVFNISANQVDSTQAAADRNAAGTEQGQRFGSQVQDGQSADNNGSRLGFQGEQGQFFFAIELGLGTVDNDEGRGDRFVGLGSTRHAFVGFNSGVGTFTFGRVNTAYKLAGQRLDPFYDTSAANFVGGFAPEGGSYGLSNLVNGWTDNSVTYLSPEVAGLSVNAGVHLQEQNDEDHDYSVGIDYRLGSLTAGVQYLTIGADLANGVIAGAGQVVDTSTQVTAHYEGEGWTVGASYELVDLRQIDDERGYAFLSGTFDLGDITLAATVGQVDEGAGEGEGATLGAFVNLIEDFQLYGLYSYADLENDTENNTVSFGVRYAFEI